MDTAEEGEGASVVDVGQEGIVATRLLQSTGNEDHRRMITLAVALAVGATALHHAVGAMIMTIGAFRSSSIDIRCTAPP